MLGLVYPFLEIRQHRIIGAPPITIAIIIFFGGACFDLPGLHEHQRYRFLDHILFNGYSDGMSAKFLPEDLFCNRVGNLWVEMLTVNDDLVSPVILDEPSSLYGGVCA